MHYAIEHTPCIFIDASNCANPPRYGINDDRMHDVFVVQAELLYTLRDTLRDLPRLVQDLHTTTIIISPFDRVFNYHDEVENSAVFSECWELLYLYGKEYHILAGIGKTHEPYSHTCDTILEADTMGHTIWSARVQIDEIRSELLAYSRALRKEEREAFEQLLKAPLHDIGPITYASSAHTWALLLISIIRNLDKKITLLEESAKHGARHGGDHAVCRCIPRT